MPKIFNSGTFRKGHVMSISVRNKISDGMKLNVNAYKGDQVGYQALHMWIRKTLGKARKCLYCSEKFQKNGQPKKYAWSNISGQYKRVISDWHELCYRCNLLDGVKVPKRLKLKK